MQLKKIACTVALFVLLASPCAASPWTAPLEDFLDSILALPRALAGLSEQEKNEEASLPPQQVAPDSPGALTQTGGLEPDDPSTEKGGEIDPGG